MLFLLRRIRRKLLSNNKVTTYLLYAIGEIFLVVIGILIAVQIDDWNEEQKLKAKETTYYCKLSEDLRQDEQQLIRLIHETEERIFHSNKLLALLQKKELDTKSIANETFQSISLATFTFKPSTSSFEDIKSSGNIGLLKEEIKKNLIAYYSRIEGIVDVIDTNADYSVKLSNDKESYSKFGWQLIDRIDAAIDSSVVDKIKLKALVIADEEYRAKMTSDAIYFVSAGSRVKMLYEELIKDVSSMKEMLETECTKTPD